LNNAGNAFRAPGAEAEPRRELLRFRAAAAAARLRIIDYRRAAIIEPANQGSRDVGLFAFSHALLDIAAAVRAPAAQSRFLSPRGRESRGRAVTHRRNPGGSR